MSGHGTWILQTNSSRVEFLGKAKCISHSQKTLPAHYTLNLAKRLTVLHRFINYDLFTFAILQLARISEEIAKKGRNGLLVEPFEKTRQKYLFFFVTPDFLKMIHLLFSALIVLRGSSNFPVRCWPFMRFSRVHSLTFFIQMIL